MAKKLNRKTKKSRPSRVMDKCLSVIRSAKDHAATRPGFAPEIYSAIGGLKGVPEGQFVASEARAIVRAAAAVLQELEKKAKKGETHFYRCTIALPIFVAIELIDVDVAQLQKLKRDLKKSGVRNAVGMIQLRASPADNRHRCWIRAVIELIIFGQDVSSTLFDAACERMREKHGGDGETISFERIEPSPTALQAAVAQVFDVSEGDEKSLKRQAKELGLKGWSKRRPLRDFCRLFALASVPFRCMAFGIGDGQRLVKKAIVDGRDILENMSRAHPPVIHRDAIARFIAAEFVRLRMKDFMLPFIKYR